MSGNDNLGATSLPPLSAISSNNVQVTQGAPVTETPVVTAVDPSVAPSNPPSLAQTQVQANRLPTQPTAIDTPAPCKTLTRPPSSVQQPLTIRYDAAKLVGSGSFGAVFSATVVETGETVAIKKVLQDQRFKNRELQIMRQLAKQPHPFIVTLRHHFGSKGAKPEEVYLHLVLEYVPETVVSMLKMFKTKQTRMPLFSVGLYAYQMFRSLAHIHGMGICHRDIKPHNLLVNPTYHVLKLCDFGSAKAFVRGEPNVSYICSRFYRAPELIFGATNYTTAIDVWSAGCVFAEMLLNTPIFPGISSVDQLVEIIKVLGTPTREEIYAMNPGYDEFHFPLIDRFPFKQLFPAGSPPELIELIQSVLCYVPSKRLTAIEAAAHPFFDFIRNPETTFPDKSPLSDDLFMFTEEELSLATPEVREKLLNHPRAGVYVPPNMEVPGSAPAAVEPSQ